MEDMEDIDVTLTIVAQMLGVKIVLYRDGVEIFRGNGAEMMAHYSPADLYPDNMTMDYEIDSGECGTTTGAAFVNTVALAQSMLKYN